MTSLKYFRYTTTRIRGPLPCGLLAQLSTFHIMNSVHKFFKAAQPGIGRIQLLGSKKTKCRRNRQFH